MTDQTPREREHCKLGDGCRCVSEPALCPNWDEAGQTPRERAPSRDVNAAAHKIMQCGDADILSFAMRDPDMFRDIASAYVIAAQVVAERAPREPFRWFHPSRWRHKKRGTSYNVLTATAEAQCATGPINEGDHVTVYQDEGKYGNWYIRKTDEFQDGRFARIDLTEGWPDTSAERAKLAASDRPFQPISRQIAAAIIGDWQNEFGGSGPDTDPDFDHLELAFAQRMERQFTIIAAEARRAGESAGWDAAIAKLRAENVCHATRWPYGLAANFLADVKPRALSTPSAAQERGDG